MNSRKTSRLPILLFLAALLLLFTPVVRNSLAASEISAEKFIQQAWQRASDLGAYQFDTSIEQTTYPAPAIANVGRSSQTQNYFLQGAVDREAESLSLMLWQNEGNLASGQNGFEMHIQDGRAYGRSIGGTWQEIDDFSGIFAPGSDPLAYLAGAENLQPLSSAGLPASVRAFSFEIDGLTFASYLRRQLEDQLRRTGELPPGINLDTPRAYREMSGTGQIWLDGAGLPLRLGLDLTFPKAQTGERVTAAIQTDFAGFARQTANAVAFGDDPLSWAAAALEISNTPQGWQNLGYQMRVWLLLTALVLLFIRYRRSKRVYAAIVGTVILSMVFTPLLQSQQVAAFYERQEQAAAQTETQTQAREAAQQAETALTSDWDPHQSPISNHQSPASSTNSENAADTDLDGLTDELESAFGSDPALADSDGDTLDDGVELLRLGTDPLTADSDGDGIYDNVEVAGFQQGNQDWYLDPNSADSNTDGRTDMIECPDLVGRADGTGYACLDQDADGTPDPFDRDDDGDGLADRIDLYPDGLVDRNGAQSNGQNLNYFNGDQPFKFKVEALESDLPVLVDFQLVPKNRDHLTYALNVLDWPSQDTEGQVQHVKNTTFAEGLSAAQIQASPSAAYGDMRLIPMLEIVMTGSQVPLPLTAPVIEIPLEDEILGSLRLEQNASDLDKTNFIFSLDDASTDYTVKIYEGGCPVSGTPWTPTSTVRDGDTFVFDRQIVDLADGSHALTISDGSEGDCTSLGNIVNGPYRDQMVDPEPLQAYGIRVREIDQNGKLAAYVPVNMVPHETGSGRAAFQARMVYQSGQNANWKREQQVRLVWLVQMLTDACDTSGFTSIVGEEETSADARLKTWCAAPQNRTPDGIQIVQTYEDAWVLTGMSVREDHGLDTAIIYEDPANGDLVNSENLWQAAFGLSAAFLSGRDTDGDSVRDVSVYTYDSSSLRIGNTNLYNRLDAEGNIPDGDEARWGIEQGALQVERERYPHQDYNAYQAMNATPAILDNFAQDTIPTLLFAREEHFRGADLSASALQDGVFSFDMDTRPTDETITGLRWMPYRYNVGTGPDGQTIGWEPYPANEYWDQLEIQYQDLFAQLAPELENETHLGQAAVARAYYVSLMQGMAQQVHSGSELYWMPDPAGDSDASIIAGLSSGYGKKIESLVYSITTDFLEEYGRSAFAEVAFDRYNNVHIAWYEEVHGFWHSIGKSVKANTVGPWIQLFSGGFKTKLAGGIALAGGVAVLGLTLFGVSQAGGGGEIAEIVLAGLGVIMAIQSVASMVVNIASSVEKFGSMTAAMRGNAASISANAKSSISKAAVIGLIIGVVITWGTVAVMLGLQGGLGGGISGTAVANAIAGAIASTVVAIIMFAIAAIPIVGWIIAAVVGIIDALVSMLCTIFVPAEAEDHPAVSWFCGGLTGIVTKALTVLIYSGNQMVNMFPEDYNRLEFSNFEADDLVHPDWGLRQGNSIRYGVSLTNTLDIAPLPDNLGAGYRYQYNDNTLRSATFDYQLTYTNTSEIHEDLDRKTMSGDWIYEDGDGPAWGDFGHTWYAPERVYVEQNVKSAGIELSQAGINLPATLFLTEGYAIPAQNCILGICTIWTERSSEHYDLGSAILLDVFPATLTDFYQLTAKNEGYALAWAQTGEDAFPRLQDADGDGIPYYTDQHDNTWDNDQDTLSDNDEARLGTNPDDADSDNDGLRDDLELLAGTNPLRPDSDGDGLLDGEEVFHQDIFDQDGNGDTDEWVGGWVFTYDLAADGTPLETWVLPSALSGDSDGDTLTDYQEKTYGMNPDWPSTPNVLTFESSLLEPAGSGYAPSDGFVQPGETLRYEAVLTNELYNRWMHGLLGTDFPTGFGQTDLSPQDFLLYPQEAQILSGTLPLAADLAPGVYNLTQNAGALVADWRAIAQDASLWYPLDDDTQAVTFADRAGSIPAHDGACSNPAPGVGCVPVKNDGVFGGSLRLDGTDYVISHYDPADSEYAISIWFKTSQAEGALFAALGAYDLDRQIYLHNGQVRVELRRGSQVQTLASPGTYNNGQWHHLVHTFGASISGQRLYLDGILVASGNLSRATSTVNSQITIGQATPSMSNFSGKIDDLRLYEKSLSQAEVEVLFGSPVLDLRFNRDSGWRDSSPFRNNVTCSVGSCPEHAGGIDGGAADFNGLTYLTAGAGDSLDLSEGGFTIGAWIYPDETPRYCAEREWLSPDCSVEVPQPQGILGFGTGGGNAYPSLQRVGKQLRFTFGDHPYFTTGDVLQANRWNHIAVTFDGSAAKIFVNGELVAQDATTFAGQVPPENSTLTVGRSGNRAVLKAQKIWVETVGEGENTAEICLAFRPENGKWTSLLDQDIDENVLGSNGPVLVEIDTQANFSNGGTLLMWENDMAPRCVTVDNEWDDSPINGTDDRLYLDTFQTVFVSEGQDGPADENYAVFNYAGSASGYVYYVYENDSIPFHGRIDEVQIYHRALDEGGIAALHQAHRQALHLKFDEAPGASSFADASFDPQQGSCGGDDCPVAGVPGRVNQAVLFDGDDVLNLGKSELNRLAEELTLAAWVRPEHLNGLQWIAASARTNSANGYGLALDGDGLRFQAFGVQTYEYPAAGLQGGEWVHIAAVLEADHNVSFYINGVLAYFAAGNAAVVADTDDVFLIGAGTLSGSATRQNFFHGEIDDLQIYSNALGEAGIQKLYGRAPFVQLHLDEGILLAGTFYYFPDAAHSAYSAACQGTPCPQFGTAIDGQLQTAVEFDGVEDNLTYAYRPELDQSDFTLSAWVRPTEVKDGWQTLAARGDRTDTAYGLFIQPDSMIPAFAFCAGQNLPAANPLIQNTWNHLAAVKENGVMKIYLNGQNQGQMSASGGYCNQGEGMRIGGAYAAADSAAFSGRIDEVNFYTQPLDETEIAEMFGYQAKWVEERQHHAVTVDDDLPAVELTTTGEYLPLNDIQMLITASDPTSGIATVEFGVRAPGESGYTWQTAAPCQDSVNGTAWCPTFDPAVTGAYSLRARIIDRVDHTNQATASITVENGPPTGSFDFAPNALLTPVPDTASPNTWRLALSGTVSDPSGVPSDTLTLALLDADGLLVPPGAQRATLNGDAWTIDYAIRNPEPSGAYTVRLTAPDEIAVRAGLDTSQTDLHTLVLEQSLQLDASPPTPTLDSAGLPSLLAETQTITGSVTEAPALLNVVGIAAVETALVSQLPGSSSYNLAPLSGKLLHLPLDESPSATGRLYFNDLSGLGFNGVCGGACPAAAQVGHVGSAVSFDGLDDEILVAQDQDLGNRDQLSIAIWLYPQGDSTGVFLYKDHEFALLRSPLDGMLYFQLGNTAPGWGNWITHGAALPAGKWTHFALTYDGVEVQTYLNGQPFQTAAASGDLPNQGNLTLGSDGNGQHFRGRLDDLQVYERTLNLDEIQALYLGAAPVLHLPLEAAWANDGAILPDTSGWDNHAHLTTGSQTNNTSIGQVGAYALEFDGLDDYALTADSPALDLEQFSLSLWVNADHWVQNATFHPLLVKGTAENAQVNYGLYLDQQNGNLSLRIDDATCSTPTYFPSSQPLMSGTWNHIAATYDGVEVVLYLNQQEVWRSAYTGGTCQNNQPLRIGQGLGGSITTPIYQGVLDDVLIYPRALESGEIKSLFARGWQTATTTPTGPGIAQANWQAQIPNGLEGVYQIDLRAWDVNGNVGAPRRAAWEGPVDTRVPRLTLEAELLGDSVRYTATAADFNLAPDGLVTPCGAEFDGQTSYFQVDWYRALFPNTPRLFGLESVCERPSSDLPGEVGAADTPGLARSVVISSTLAYLADSEGGLQIIDFSNPAWPQIIGTVPAGYANDLAVASGGPVLPPDLTVTSLEASPADPTLGTAFSISVTVQNLGTGDAPGFDLALYQEAQPTPCEASVPLWTAAIPGLDAGQAAVVVFAHPGLNDLNPHDFYAQSDSGCAVLEADEPNNIFGPAAITAVQADLIVESLVLEPAAIYDSQPLTVTVTVRNQGTGAAGNFRTALFPDTVSAACGDPGWDFDDTAQLAAGEAVSFSYLYPGFSTGAHSFLAVVDSECSLDENEEFNNTASANFTVLPEPQPDLAVTGIQVSPPAPLISETLAITVTIENVGQAAAGAFDVAVFEDYTPLACGDPNGWDFSRLDGGLAPGASAQVTFTHSGFGSAGMHTITSQADSACEIFPEDDEANNTLTQFVNVIDPNQPDLVVDSLMVPPSVVVDQTYLVTATITNQGPVAADTFWGEIDLGIYVDHQPTACEESADGSAIYYGPIAADETVVISVTMPGITGVGSHELYVFMDQSCAVTEADEANNFFGPQTLTVSTSVLAVRGAAAVFSSPSLTSLDTFLSVGEGLGARVELPQIYFMPASAVSPTSVDATTADPLYAFLASTDGLHIINVDDPGSPTAVAALNLPGIPRGIALGDEIAYLATQYNGLHAVEVSNPGYPALLDTLPLSGRGEGVAVSGNYAYVAAGTAGLHIVDIQDPVNLILTGSYDTPGYAYDVTLFGNYALVADGGRGLQVIDISDQTNPQLEGTLDTNYLVKGVASAGTEVYLADGNGGLQVSDIRDPANPVWLRRFDTPGSAEGLAVSNNFTLVADHSSGLRIINPNGELPQATACDRAGNCATTTMTQSFANLAEAALRLNPRVEINYALTAGPLLVEFTNLPPVLDSYTPITVTGYASTTLTTLDAITVTVDGAPLAVTGWSSGAVESAWSAAWTPGADGPYHFWAEVSDADGTTASSALTITVDTLAPSLTFSPTLYTGADYHEPRSIDLRGETSDEGGVTKVEILGLDGIWREASLIAGNWHGSWQLGNETLPDHETKTIWVRATDIAGHTTTISETITVDVLPPAPVTLTLSSGGVTLQPGDILPLDTANLTLDWTASSDGGGLTADYQIGWQSQITSTATQSWENISTGAVLTSAFTAYDGQKISVLWGIEDTLGNQRWQDWGSVVVDSPFTPDYAILTKGPFTPELDRGWMDSGCTDLGVERRAEAGSHSQGQEFFTTWSDEALRLAWLGADWDADGDLFIYLDTRLGGTNTAFDPFGNGPQISLPDGMLADALIWVSDRAQAQLLQWTGSDWNNEPLSAARYQWVLMPGTQTPVTDLYLPFDQIGLAVGGSLGMVAFAAEEGSLDLWAARPLGNSLNSPRVTNYAPAAGEERDFSLTQLYAWAALTAGICPNGSDQPDSSTAFPDTDLQVRWEASPAGAGYSLLGDGLYWLQDELLNSPPADFSTQLDFLVVDQAALPNTQIVTYTLQIHNRGADTAYDVQAVVSAELALRLLEGDPVQQTIVIGDIPAGESETITLRGQIDTSLSDAAWARAAVGIYDAAHPVIGTALENLWLDQRVDREGPIFVGLTEPRYLLGPGMNWLSGYAYDASGVSAVEIEAQGPPGTETLTCALDAPFSGGWACPWDVAGQNGDLFNLSLQATDGYSQPGAWNRTETRMLDTQPPTITLDISATHVISGALVQGLNFSLVGDVADNGGLGEVEVCLEGDCQPAMLALNAGTPSVVVDDSPGTTIPLGSATPCNGGEIVRTFEITQSLRVGDLRVGIRALHERRADLRAVLTAPNGITVTLLTEEGLSGMNFQNADFWLHDAARVGYADWAGDHAPGMPFYAFEARPANPLQVLSGVPAQGTWSLSICDASPGTDEGSYLRSQLLIEPLDPYAKSGRWSAQVQRTSLLDYVPQTVAIFGQDVVGNRTENPLEFGVIVDNIAPVITLTQALSEGYLGQSGRVLAGSWTEGGPSASLWVHVRQPNGETQRILPARLGDTWYFEMDYENLGEHQLWLTARDLAGNTSVAGMYAFEVLEEPRIYLPLVYNRYDGNMVYELDDSPGPEWSSQETETAPNGEIFLGPFNQDSLALNLDDLPPHSAITISFDLYIIRSWDGNQVQWGSTANQIYPSSIDEIVGPDIWAFQAGGQTLLTTTFSNWGALGFEQAFPDAYPGGSHPAQTGAVAVNTLGYYFDGYAMDATYHLTFTFDHNESTLQSGFSASSLQIGEDESWGIDNVQVFIVK